MHMGIWYSLNFSNTSVSFFVNDIVWSVFSSVDDLHFIAFIDLQLIFAILLYKHTNSINLPYTPLFIRKPKTIKNLSPPSVYKMLLLSNFISFSACFLVSASPIMSHLNPISASSCSSSVILSCPHKDSAILHTPPCFSTAEGWGWF